MVNGLSAALVKRAQDGGGRAEKVIHNFFEARASLRQQIQLLVREIARDYRYRNPQGARHFTG